MNHFYRMWHDAERQKNEYVPTEVHWSEVPGRDEAWKEQTIANTSEQQFKVEFECEFLGSVNTLTNPAFFCMGFSYTKFLSLDGFISVLTEPKN